MSTVVALLFCVFFSLEGYATATESPSDKALVETKSHIENLRPPTPDAQQLCTADQQWCLSLNGKVDDGGGVTGRTLVVQTSHATQTYSLPDLPDDDRPPEEQIPREDDERFTLWPTRIVSASGEVLVGLLSSQRTGYAGSGVGLITLELFRLDASGKAESVLSVLWQSWEMVRTCDIERANHQRWSACHIGHDYTSKLSVMTQNASGFPVLRYRSVATEFPRGVVRVDRACSVTRELRYSPKLRAYVPNRPLPECHHSFNPL